MSKRKRGFSDDFFNVYHRVPDGVKKYTDPLVKTAIKTERRMKPVTDKARLDANSWVDKNVLNKVNGVKKRVPFINRK
jgi:hypothetical protein